MPLWYLPDQFIFPHPLAGTENGLLAIGGDLSMERLKLAYSYGIFPWYSEGDPILWWFPDPRCVMKPEEVVISKSMRLLLNKKSFSVSFDSAFSQVIAQCRSIPRRGQDGTWIQPEMVEAYSRLHEGGYAHSVEIWKEDKLVGGLYGIAMGRVFFGESMFSLVSNASKYALIALADFLHRNGFWLIDCQENTPHVRRLGAQLMTATEFSKVLSQNRFLPEKPGKWSDTEPLLPL